MSVVVVGSVNTDVVARVARVPGPGETVLGRDVVRHGGGKGANQAVAAARAGGAAVTFIGAVGSDAEAEVRRSSLRANAVDTTGLVTVPGPTGTALIAVADDGENVIIVVPGANGVPTSLSTGQLDVVGRAEVVVAQLEVTPSLVIHAAQTRPEGSLFVLNAAPSSALTDPAVADALFELTDVLVVNEHELADLARGAEGHTAVDVVAERVPVVVVTAGSAGVLIAAGAERRSVPAFDVPVVDTTGAGDTFCGVLAARLAAARPRGAGVPGIDVITAGARVAAAAAALAVGRPGAEDSVPEADEVARLLASAPHPP